MKPSLFLNTAMYLIYALLIIMPQMRYLSMHAHVLDLGVIDNIVQHAVTHPFRAIDGHVQPVALLYGLIARICGSCSTSILLLIQSLVIITSLHFLYSKIDTLAGFLLALHPAIWWLALNDFHFDHLAVLVIVLFYYFYEKNAYGKACIASLLLLFVKESFSLVTIFSGVLFLVTNMRNIDFKRIGLGIILIISGAIWFYITTGIILPKTYAPGVTQFSTSAFSWLGSSLPDLLTMLITRPFYVLSQTLNEPKRLLFLAILFGGFGFMIFKRIYYLIPVLPLLAIALLSKNDVYYSYTTHYMVPMATALAIVFAHTYRALPSPIVKYGAIISALMCHALFAISPVSRLFVSERYSSFNWHNFVADDRTAIIKNYLKNHRYLFNNQILSVQNSLYYGTFNQAERIIPFPQGIEQPHPFYKPEGTEYKLATIVIVDNKREHFYIDQGCQYFYGECKNAEIEASYQNGIDYLKTHYQNIYSYDGFVIYQKAAP